MPKLTDEQKEELRNKLGKPKKDEIKVDDANVAIAEMKINALLQMADDNNSIFSQVRKEEVFDISRALMFSKNALPSITERIEKKFGEQIVFDLPILEGFIYENFKHLHKTDRLRVPEFLDGLRNITQTNNLNNPEVKKQGLLNRLV